MAKFNKTIHVKHPEHGKVIRFLPGDEVPGWVKKEGVVDSYVLKRVTGSAPTAAPAPAASNQGSEPSTGDNDGDSSDGSDQESNDDGGNPDVIDGFDTDATAADVASEITSRADADFAAAVVAREEERTGKVRRAVAKAAEAVSGD